MSITVSEVEYAALLKLRNTITKACQMHDDGINTHYQTLLMVGAALDECDRQTSVQDEQMED
jgi:hypothetical protein